MCVASGSPLNNAYCSCYVTVYTCWYNTTLAMETEIYKEHWRDRGRNGSEGSEVERLRHKDKDGLRWRLGVRLTNALKKENVFMCDCKA